MKVEITAVVTFTAEMGDEWDSSEDNAHDAAILFLPSGCDIEEIVEWRNAKEVEKP